MAAIDTMKKRATALAGCPAPGDARAAARLVADLCDHVGNLESAVTEMIDQLSELRAEITALKRTEGPSAE